MYCANCGKEIVEHSNFCYFCGSKQSAAAGASAGTSKPFGERRLYRSSTDKTIAGVLGGFAEYLEMDSTMLRVVYVLITVFTGVIPGGIIYLVAWVVMSEEPAGQAARTSAGSAKRLTRSITNRKWAGVCGGLGEYLDVDPTVVRIIWVVLSIVPGSIIGGLIVYLLAWMVMPEAPHQTAAAPQAQGDPIPHSS